jgi:protein-disulfide isomerase
LVEDIVKKNLPGKKKKPVEKTPIAVYIGIGLIAILVVYALIQISQPDSTIDEDVSNVIPQGVSAGVNDTGNATLGDLDAEVQVALYEDFGCHNCKTFTETIEPDFIDEFVLPGKVLLISYPVAFVNQQSIPAAEAAQCALAQGKFWEYRHILFLNQGVVPFTRDNLLNFANTAGVNVANFQNCFDLGEFRNQVRTRTVEAQAKGVEGTPSFIINGNLYVGMLNLDSDNPDRPGLRQIINSIQSEK